MMTPLGAMFAVIAGMHTHTAPIDVAKSITERIEQVRSSTLPANSYYEWTWERYAKDPKRLIERYGDREISAADPNFHSLQLARVEQRGEVPADNYRVWWGGDNYFRWSQDTTVDSLPFWDHAVADGKAAWGLAPDRLTLVSPDAETTSGGWPFLAEEAVDTIRNARAAGLQPNLDDWSLISSETTTTGWKAVITGTEPGFRRTVRAEVEGTWFRDRIPVATSATCVYDGVLQVDFEFVDWQWSSVLDDAYCTMIVHRGKPEFREQRTTFTTITSIDESELARVTTTPSPETGDAVRGDVQFVEVIDNRSAPPNPYRKAPSQMPSGSPDPDKTDWLTVGGWIGAVAIVVALIGIRIARRNE